MCNFLNVVDFIVILNYIILYVMKMFDIMGIIELLKFKGNEYYRFMTSGFDRKYSSTLYYVVCCHVSVLFACLYSNHRLSHWLHALSSTLCTTSNANVYFHTRYLFANKIVRKYHSQKNGHGCCFTSVITFKL